MLLLLPKPNEVIGYHPLAVNLQIYDEISISKDAETNLFRLDLAKLLDAHGSNQSVFHYTLGIFQSAEDCLQLFQEIVDALNSGSKTFELPPPELPRQTEVADPQDRRSGIL